VRLIRSRRCRRLHVLIYVEFLMSISAITMTRQRTSRWRRIHANRERFNRTKVESTIPTGGRTSSSCERLAAIRGVRRRSINFPSLCVRLQTYRFCLRSRSVSQEKSYKWLRTRRPDGKQHNTEVQLTKYKPPQLKRKLSSRTFVAAGPDASGISQFA
jgi:hypothetical protein